MKIIDKCMKHFFDKLYAKEVVKQTKPKKVILVLPFMGSTSLKLKKNGEVLPKDHTIVMI